MLMHASKEKENAVKKLKKGGQNVLNDFKLKKLEALGVR